MGKRRYLAAAALVCLGLLCFMAIRFSSPVSKTVEPLPEIEAIWDIEDTHTPAETPLLTALYRDGAPLVRDSEGTFYCCLGLETGEKWPELSLSLPQGVSACFADDYLWDACRDAIAAGTRYRLLVWTGTEYGYQDIVFTGFPLVSLSCEREPEEILGEDVPADLLFSAPGESLSSHARMHRRGGASFIRHSEKRGYRVELTRRADGTGKIRRQIPVVGEADTFILLPIVQDETKMRERLGWEIWNALCEEGEPFGKRNVFYCEVFLNGDYRGVYLAMEPYSAREELLSAGGGEEGSVYRTAVTRFLRGRRAIKHPMIPAGSYRVYAASGADDAAGIEPYTQLLMEDDEALARDFESRMDVESLLRFDLFVQACAMADNVFNNMYVCVVRREGQIRIRVAPWDLDLSFGMKPEDIGQEYENWVYYPLMDRALYLDLANLRARYAQKWAEYRGGVFSLQTVTALAERLEAELNDSGAMARDAERWQTGQYSADGQKLLDFFSVRMSRMDETVSRIAAGDCEFLTLSQYQEKGGPTRMPEGDETAFQQEDGGEGAP